MKQHSRETLPRSTESVRRDAWRTQLFHEQVAKEMAEREHARALRRSILAGVAIGVAGSIALSL